MTGKKQTSIVNALLTVLRIERLSHSFIRINFSCDKQLTVNPLWICPHLKLLFADPSTGTIIFPQLDDNNKILINDKIRQLARSYSIRHYDETTQQLTIDFAIHQEGLASVWAQQAKVNDQIGLVGTAAKLMFNQQSLVLIGDITAVPAICYTLEHLPNNVNVQAFIEVNHPTDIMALPNSLNTHVNWLIQDVNQPNQLVETIKKANIVHSDNLLIWGGMERDLAQQIRHTLKDNYPHLPPDAFHIISYWRHGFAEGEFKHRE